MKKQRLEDVFRQNLRKHRKLARLSQESVSNMVDKNINYINTIESGKSMPPISMIQKIADAIGVKPSALFETDEADEKRRFDQNKRKNDASRARAYRSLAMEISQEINRSVIRILAQKIRDPFL